jgi:hypothetical protein
LVYLKKFKLYFFLPGVVVGFLPFPPLPTVVVLFGCSVGWITVEPSKVNSKNVSKFKEPLPVFVSNPDVAPDFNDEATCDGESVGFAAINRAITPATNGEAIEVPLIVLLAEVEPIQAEVI